MNTSSFVEQQSNERILTFVARYCAECYREFRVGETIFYDMQEYRYLCTDCADKLAERREEACEIIEETNGEGLFGL